METVKIKEPKDLIEIIEAENVATILGKADVDKIGQHLKEEFNSRGAWCTERHETLRKFIDMFLSKTDIKSWPWHGAANVVYPLITVAVNEFWTVFTDVFPECKVAKAETTQDFKTNSEILKATGGDRQMAVQYADMQQQQKDIIEGLCQRVGSLLNYQLTEEMPEWLDDTIAMGQLLPLCGLVLRKCYYDPIERRPCHKMVAATHVYANEGAVNVRSALWVAEKDFMYEKDFAEYFSSGHFSYVDLPDSGDDDKKIYFIEMMTYLDLDGDGISEPYIVWFLEEEGTVLRIEKLFEEQDIIFDEVMMQDESGEVYTEQGDILKIKPQTRYIDYRFMPNPEMPFFGMSFCDLLMHTTRVMSTLMNQTIDSATKSNLGGGIYSTSLNMKAGTLSFRPNEWKPVRASGEELARSFYPFPNNQPSPVLLELINMLDVKTQQVANIDQFNAENMQPDMSATVGMIMADKGIGKFRAIFKGIKKSLDQEIQCLLECNRKYFNADKYARIANIQLMPEELEANVYKVASNINLNSLNNVQKMARLQFLMGWNGDPTIDQTEIRREVFKGYEFNDCERFIIQPPIIPQPDPMQELTLKKLEKEIDLFDKQGNLFDAQAEGHRTKSKDIELMQPINYVKTAADATDKMASAESREQGTQIKAYTGMLQGFARLKGNGNGQNNG